MPANLTPEYEKAEQRYRQAKTDEEKLLGLQEMLRTIPKHKGTDKMQADLKRRISQARRAAVKKSGKRGVDFFHVPKTGAGQIVLVGLPNVGKSALVAATTNAPVKVADYPHTTAVPTPGMWHRQDVQLQLVDTPPVTAGQVPPGLMGTIRSADVILIVVDAAGACLQQAEGVLALLDGRGLQVRSTPRRHLDPEDRTRYSGLIAANKADLAQPDDLAVLRELYAERLEVLPISCTTGEGLETLSQRLWELLDVIRVYTKEPGKPTDDDQPYTLPAGATLEDLAREIHRDLPGKMRYARIWGGGRFDGQRAQRSEVLRDKDVVEIHQ